MFCGALNALCFNFINEITIKELFGICVNALRSSVDEISENASKCLKKIVTEFHDLEDIIIDLVSLFLYFSPFSFSFLFFTFKLYYTYLKPF